MATFLSPIELATDPVRVNVPETSYDWQNEKLRVVSADEASTAFSIKMAITWNTTRTYDFNGKPNDSDHD